MYLKSTAKITTEKWKEIYQAANAVCQKNHSSRGGRRQVVVVEESDDERANIMSDEATPGA
jgi:hypothetical protein